MSFKYLFSTTRKHPETRRRFYGNLLLLLHLFAAHAWADSSDGLPCHYPIDEAAGNWVHDKANDFSGGECWPSLVDNLPADELRHRISGFKTASSGANQFVIGYGIRVNAAFERGFIAMLNPAGSVDWLKTMAEIMGESDWNPHDVNIFGERLYVCGLLSQTGSNQGFVANTQ